MLVHRGATRQVDSVDWQRALIEQLAQAASQPQHDRLRDVLIEVGEFEAAIGDGLSEPGIDGLHPVAGRLRDVTVEAARALWLSWRGASWPERRDACSRTEQLLRRVPLEQLPRSCRLATAEGYAYYAVYPEMYFASVDRLARGLAFREAVVLGVRSIGTSLGAAVVAALRGREVTATSWAIRPGGHPFDRRWRPREDLAVELRLSAADALFLVVDEGPGLSASTFAAVAEGLAEIGVAADRIVFVASREADSAQFVSARGRQSWARHRHVAADFDELYLDSRRLQRRFSVMGLRDYSAGAWRTDVLDIGQALPPVHPHHERRKYRAADGPLLKFIGFGRYGREYASRARALARAGWSAPFIAAGDGFGLHTFLPGRTLGPRDAGPDVLATCGRYLSWVRRRFTRQGAVSPEPLLEMMQVNISEALGEKWIAGLDGVAQGLALSRSEPAVDLDARMFPHEWIATRHGVLKVDAVEHHDDHFFPGPSDIAWDVASAVVEFDLDRYRTRFLLEHYVRASGDSGIEERLPAFIVAYLAFRAGYTKLAAATLGISEDGIRFSRAARRYARRLRRALVEWPAVVCTA